MKWFLKSARLRQVVILFFIAISTPALSQASDAIKDSKSANFWLFPDVGSNSGAWLLNTRTGSLSKCVFVSTNETPKCSPWANPPGENPTYRYDMKSEKMIPMNEAARKKENEKDPLGLLKYEGKK